MVLTNLEQVLNYEKEDLNDYVYVDNQKSLNFCCDPGYENYYVNRKCKFVRIENDGSAIFYRDY